jgi:hypothetical protein
MSFALELAVEGLTDEQGRRVEEKARERATWPIHYAPRRRRRFAVFGPRAVGPALWMPEQRADGQDLLGDEAMWDAPAWEMEWSVLPSFADAIRVLGEELPQGFTLWATWSGSWVEQEHVMSADELADLAAASLLHEFTPYRVPPREPRAGG